MVLAGAAIGAGACSSPTKPPPVDPYPDAPKITCPAAPPPVTSSDGKPIRISYGTPTAIGGAPPVVVACTPAADTSFNVGTTAVTCTATDARQRLDACTFNVTVLAPPKIRVTRFATFGDSITWGENGVASGAYELFGTIGPRFQVARTYPTALYQKLALRYTTQNPAVGNFGVGGEYAGDSGTRARFSDIVRSGAWDAILLMEGSNDVNRQSESITRAAIDSLGSMLRDAKSRGVRPYIATIPPMDALKCCPRRGIGASDVPGFNERIKALAVTENVTLVDVYSALVPSINQYLSDDGLHPNEAGYEKIADTFFEALKATLEIPAASVTSDAWPMRVVLPPVHVPLPPGRVRR